MTSRHRSLVLLVSLLALPITACDLIDPTCPPGTWRERAMEDCVPIPYPDAGTARDAGGADAATADAGADSGIDAATDATVPDAAAEDAAAADAGDGG